MYKHAILYKLLAFLKSAFKNNDLAIEEPKAMGQWYYSASEVTICPCGVSSPGEKWGLWRAAFSCCTNVFKMLACAYANHRLQPGAKDFTLFL